VLPGAREASFRAAVAAAATTIRDAYVKTDPGVTLSVAIADGAADAWSEDGTASLLDLLAVLPSGPVAMSPDFDSLVETSTSLGEAATEGGTLRLHQLSRSSNASALPELIATLAAAARLAGGRLELDQSDPGWRPNLDSPALAACRRVYEGLFGDAPVVTAVHAWLETAVIGDRVAGLDMVSFGPKIEGPHSPDERVSIPTVERFWRLLVGAVDELSKPAPGHHGA
jgi:dipeptidase D